MEIKSGQIISVGIGFLIIVIGLLIGNKYTAIILGIGFLVAVLPFVLSIMEKNKIENEKERMFLEFSRNLVESVKTGTPISKSIINAKDKNYGFLSPYIKKLANQISLGIPFSIALRTLAIDIENKNISRALTLIGQAETAGGNISEILESVTGAVNMSDKLKKERKSSISTLIVQGYIIFVIFIAIILILQFKILPMLSGINIAGVSGVTIGGLSLSSIGGVSSQELSGAFLNMILIQGFFNGLVIGKLAEGNIKAGIKHSFALMLISFFVSTIANLLFG